MIQYYNRLTQKKETEKVYGEGALKFAYENAFGFYLTDTFFSKRWLSKLMGLYEDTKMSTKKIARFIQQYDIPMEQFEETNYSSFNDFFIRKFKSGLRPFSKNEREFGAGAEARYLAFENLKLSQKFKVKGFEIDLVELLKDEKLATQFEDGTFILARLCPVDYHRFHFPLSGTLLRRYRVEGALHSVNPVAFKEAPKVFFENEREVAIFETEHFGKVAMIEVGALGVGRIIQSAPPSGTELPVKFEKGQEKGYFLFGGSTVIWLCEKNRITLSPDLKSHSLEGLETWIPLGSPLGEASNE